MLAPRARGVPHEGGRPVPPALLLAQAHAALSQALNGQPQAYEPGDQVLVSSASHKHGATDSVDSLETVTHAWFLAVGSLPQRAHAPIQ